ncbi:MAG: ATP-dependent Clp protease ATP-binding subunit [Clostridiaceae bacterium]|nr:ATP-dependent Clp protease ATP-binding subunit [Clostridiaceae bacterium]
MSICQICKKNTAVIYTTRIENNETVSEGICLKCAFNMNIGGLEPLFKKSGINEENIDQIQNRMNSVMEQMGDTNPFEMFKSFMDPDADNEFGLLMEGLNFDGLGDFSTADDDSEELEDSENLAIDAENQSKIDSDNKSSSLMAATIDSSIGADQEGTGANSQSTQSHSTRRRTRRNKFLDQFGTNLTEKAKHGEIDRIIGRDEELNRVIQILNRRTKNNPALIGEPGVGKTAIAEGLAVKIISKEVPAKLLDKQIYQLDMTTMVAGTQFRGQFESRMKGVVEDAKKDGNVILVIDELHNIMGAGDAEGAMNAANILKPALAKGDVSVIGSTTLDEYRRFIEKDSALERRFQKVIIDEPTQAEAIEILNGVRDYYEKHHFVTYTGAAIRAAVQLSDRYIHERYLPDKAIDIIDEAGSRVNLDNDLLVEQKELQDRLAELNDAIATSYEKLIETSDEEKSLELYEKDAELRSEQLKVNRRLKEVTELLKPVQIGVNEIAEVVEMWTGIPVQQITEAETEKLLHLEERLHKRIIGQEDAVNAVSRAIRRKRAGFGSINKPPSFFFVGPTGVGKTELVKALAETLFEEKDSLVRLDMSEFTEPHTVSKLIGSPPGYVGYDDGGQLTEKIRRRPYSVVLFDEIEKAHPDIYNILLQILDDGRLTDSQGRVINFENTVIIMTSNVGTTLKAHSIGFGDDGHVAMESRVQTAMQDIFRPEFLNRIDEIIVFKELTKMEIRQIVDLMLQEVESDVKGHGMIITITDVARDALAKEGYDPKYGARPLRKAIQRKIEDPLADKLLAGDFDKTKEIIVTWDEEQQFVISANSGNKTEN